MFAPALHLSQCTHLLFFQDHSTKAGKGAVPTTDLRSLSPVRGGMWCQQPGQVVGREGGRPVGRGVAGVSPTGPPPVFPALAPLASVLVLGRA